jgi:hypothetical protein
MRRTVLQGLAIAALLTGAARADEARVPIYMPTTISAAGHYFLTRNIDANGGDGLTIATSEVTVDLNGFTISSSGASGRLIVLSDGVQDITVRNGRLAGGANAIYYSSATTTTRVTLRDLDISGTSTDAVRLTPVEHLDMIACRIGPGVGGDGVRVDAQLGVFTGRLEDLTVTGPAHNGIYLSGMRDGVLRHNLIDSPGSGSGIFMTGRAASTGGNLLEGNTVIGSGAPSVTGIYIDAPVNHNLIQKNLVESATRGLYVGSSENRIYRNLMGANGGDGFAIAGARNLLESNLAEGNVGCGLDFINTNAHAWRNNMLRGNGPGGGICNGGSPNTNAGGNICDTGICP